MGKSCLTCSNYLAGCRNPSKGANYSCEDYAALRDHSDILRLFDLDLEPKDGRTKGSAPDEAEERIIRLDQLKSTGSRKKRNEVRAEHILDGIDVAADIAYEESMRDSNEYYRAMRDGYDNLTNTVKDVRIDDGDFELALNVYDFACNFMGEEAKKPFARQLWIMAIMCAEYCPRCADKGVLNVENVEVDADPDEVADRLCLLEHGTCPRCGVGKAELVLRGELNDYVELVACLGQRSGKTVVANTIIVYWTHRALMVPKYSQMCSGIQGFSPITITLVALSFGRAYKLLWVPFETVMNTSSFFVEYHKMLHDQGKKYGVELYALRKESLRYFHKNLEIAPMGSIGRTMRGDSRLVAAVDEIGWYPLPPVEEEKDGNPEEVDRELANADAVYEALDRSLLTIRAGVQELYRKGYNHIPTGIGVYTSSPASYRDKICTMLRESEGSKRSFGVNYPTWEINPLIPRDFPEIVEAYRKNPVKAERDWGAKPPNLNAALYSREQLAPLFVGENHFALSRVVTSGGYMYGRILPLKRRFGWPGTVLALDAGMVNNSFAYALVSGRYKDSVIGADVPAIGEIIPSKETPVNFPLMYEHCIKPLIRECNVKFVVADRWNSVMLLQTIERDFPGVKCFTISMKPPDFNKADADYIHTGLVTLPKLEMNADEAERTADYRATFSSPPRPAAHLFLQFRTVKKTMIGRVKGERYTDDIYRALMLGLTCLRHPKMEETLRKSRTLNPADPTAGTYRPVVDGRMYGRMPAGRTS